MSHLQAQETRKSNKVIWGIIVGLAVVIVILLWSSQPGNTPQTGNAKTVTTSSLRTNEMTYDFGRISMANGLVSKTFVIGNEGSQPVTVNKIYTSCMCTSAVLVQGSNRFGPFGMPGHGGSSDNMAGHGGGALRQTIAPGEEVTVEVTFDPNAHGPAGVGAINRDIVIESTDNAKLVLGIKALVTP